MVDFRKKFQELGTNLLLVDEELVYKPADPLYGELHAIGSRKAGAYINPSEEVLTQIFDNMDTFVADLKDKKKSQTFGCDIIDYCPKCVMQYMRKDVLDGHVCEKYSGAVN